MRDARSYKNIVFDMGNVLAQYSSRPAIQRLTGDRALIDEIRYVVFCSYEWCLLDCGLMDEAQVAQYTLPRLSCDAARRVAAQALDTWDTYNLWPKPGMDAVLPRLKARGQKIYVLSNAGNRLLNCWRRVLPCPDLYDGIIFSAAEKCLKPQKEIYQRLFEKYAISPAECLFIDDLPWNVAASQACGMDAWQFKSGDVEELKKVLGLELQ